MKYTRYLLLLLVLCSFSGRAQSWSDMVRWVESNGKYKLAELAHPADYADGNVLGYSVSSTSSTITVKVKYQGWFIKYTDTYEIVKDVYRGKPYFRRIRVDEIEIPGDPTRAFRAIDNLGIGYENAYYRMEASPLYGGEKYHNLAKGEKAAFILYTFFLDWYFD